MVRIEMKDANHSWVDHHIKRTSESDTHFRLLLAAANIEDEFMHVTLHSPLDFFCPLNDSITAEIIIVTETFLLTLWTAQDNATND